MKNTFDALLIFLLSVLSVSVASAEGDVNVIGREQGQHGVNRRVAVAPPEDARVTGFYAISAHFNVSGMQLPSGSAITAIERAGRLPNKPSFYFGIRGPGRYYQREQIVRGRLELAHWVENAAQVEVDAGLEYDSRPQHRGWRAFISINRVQVNYSSIIGGRLRPWRGQASQYTLKFRIDAGGFAYLQVSGNDGNFEFAWNHTGVLGTKEAIFANSDRTLIGLKKVIANTRPAPPRNVAEDALDGTRFTCTSTDTKIYYSWRTNWGNVLDLEQFLSPQHPNPNVPDNANLPSHFRINATTTGYDTQFHSFDWPTARVNGQMTRNSRRRVDFSSLDRATPLSRLRPDIFDIGRGAGSEGETQNSQSRYRTETVRINLYTPFRATGRLGFIRQGGTP